MRTRRSFHFGREEEAAYHLTLRHLHEAVSRFPSWEAMIAEEENPSLSSSRPCTFLPPPPPRSLLEIWLLAATAEHAKAMEHHEDTTEEAPSCRWTRFLGLWISLRLAGLIASTKTADPTFWTETSRELEDYEQCFVAAAWPLLVGEQRQRLATRVAHLRGWHKSAPRQGSGSASRAAPSAAAAEEDHDEAACVVICNSAMRASQCVAREYLRITWDILNPKEVPAVVDQRLHLLFLIQQPLQAGTYARGTPAPTLAQSSVVHTGCMKDLLQTLQRTHEQHHTVDRTHAASLRVVRTALLQIGYDLVVKTAAAMIDFCYFLLPALVDFEACVLLCEAMASEAADTDAAVSEAAPIDAAEDEKRRQLQRTLASLFQSTQAAYEEAMARVLSHYKKRCVNDATPFRLLTTTAAEAPRNPLAPSLTVEQQSPAATAPGHHDTLPSLPPQHNGSNGSDGGRRELALSQPAYALLVAVVEPTCNILRRYSVETRPHQGEAATDAVAVHRRPSSLLGDEEPPLLRSGLAGNGVDDGRAGQATREAASWPTTTPPRPPTVNHRFAKFFEAKLASCFMEALQGAASNSAVTNAQKQATMDTYLVNAYYSVAMRHGA